MKSNTCLNIVLVFFATLFFFFRLNAQITLINEEFGIKIYPKKSTDTITIDYVKGCSRCKMKLFIQDWNGKAKFKLFDKNGILKIKGEFIGGKDTLRKYSFAKTLGFPKDKSHTNVWVLKYFYLLESGTWLYFDNNKKIIKKEEYRYDFY
jgi:hypothetical protein